MVKTYLEKLKKKKRYDSSFIVVFDDHVAGWENPNITKDNFAVLNAQIRLWTISPIESRIRAALMIKTPSQEKQRKRLFFSNIETQLIDIFPTLLFYINLSSVDTSIYDQIEGRNILLAICQIGINFYTIFHREEQLILHKYLNTKFNLIVSKRVIRLISKANLNTSSHTLLVKHITSIKTIFNIAHLE